LFDVGALVAVTGHPGVWRVVLVEHNQLWCSSYATGALLAFSVSDLSAVPAGTCTDRTVLLS
jgi:hypothetical protein